MFPKRLRGSRADIGLASALLGCAFASSPFSVAHASESSDEKVDDADEGATTPKPRAAAPDWRSGHVGLGASILGSLPMGHIVPNVAQSDVLGAGAVLGIGLSIGVSRYLSVDADGGSALYSGDAACAKCSARAWSAGLGVAYHAAQGIAIDPWVRLSMGWRRTEYSGQLPAPLEARDNVFSGIDIARIALGFRYFVTPHFALGPVFETALGTYLGRPGGSDLGASLYANAGLGLAIQADFGRHPAR